MYNSKHFEATGSHIGSADTGFFAGLGVLSTPKTHTNTPNLIRVEVKLLQFTRGSENP